MAPSTRVLLLLPLPARFPSWGLPTQPVAIVTDSRPALQALLQPDRAGVTVILLLAKLQALKDCGVRLSMHWLPSHVGIAGNEEADAAAKDAHRIDIPVTTAVAASDFSRQRLLHLLKAAHPDQRVASGHPPRPGFQWRELRLLRLRTGLRFRFGAAVQQSIAMLTVSQCASLGTCSATNLIGVQKGKLALWG
ncbi:hypothetical protein HPB52_003254 [Rhipicephalus sanguineus]|uniref:RNase H type-1 domain-containing protein n=1 Tax=Rhipicephalus sanguineus TaxID=34632 RepID=A0A9D4QE90_RHISA|nr:hypothetical protein HPB52_003254 [Rhipicephalus sanguineus]